MDDEQFYVCQKAFIKKGDETLVLNDPVMGLDFPGGKIQVPEIDLEESMKREVREETGLEIKVGKPFATWMSPYPETHPKFGKKVFFVGYKCEFVSGEVILNHEHRKYSWVTIDNYPEVDDKSHFFDILKKYFEYEI